MSFRSIASNFFLLIGIALFTMTFSWCIVNYLYPTTLAVLFLALIALIKG